MPATVSICAVLARLTPLVIPESLYCGGEGEWPAAASARASTISRRRSAKALAPRDSALLLPAPSTQADKSGPRPFHKIPAGGLDTINRTQHAAFTRKVASGHCSGLRAQWPRVCGQRQQLASAEARLPPGQAAVFFSSLAARN